jgi:hypothetical protein
MKTRTLFFTLLISISILLISNGLAFADPITGCVKKSNGKLYNVQIGATPTFPCSFLDEQITWSEQGPQGEQGPPGENGEDGQDGTIIHQMHLEDSDNTDCETQTFPPSPGDIFGWCPNGLRNTFIIPDPMITPDSVVTAHLGEIPGVFTHCFVRFINPDVPPAAPAFNFTCDAPIPDGVTLNYAIINP